MTEEEKKEFLRIKSKYKQTWLDNFDMDFLINLPEKLQKENETITQQRDYYKARYNEFNEAFIENGRKLTK